MTDKKKNTPHTTARKPRSINLALQGGGAHSGFTWGVLDRLLEEENLTIESISATSAGAMNAALVSYGMIEGRDHTRALLEKFWHRVSLILSQPLPMMEKLLRENAAIFSPLTMMLDYTAQLLSPYQLNVFDINPLRDILDDLVDFEVLRKKGKIKLFINATNVRTGKVKIFFLDEMCRDMIMASACLPALFKAVEVGGEHYWDGGYSGNPAIYPILYKCQSQDVVIVQINPLNIEELPTTVPDILNRINEISFNSTLMREMRAIAVTNKYATEGRLDEQGVLKKTHIHMIEAEEIINTLERTTKYYPDIDFLLYLKEIGRQRAEKWLEKNYDNLGEKSTIDIEKMFF